MDIEKIIDKYKNGVTSLEEEKFLFDHASELDPELFTWFQFIRNKRLKASPDLQKEIWGAIEKKKSRFRMIYLAAAASLLLIAIFSIQNLQQKEQANKEKEATLNEALALISQSEKTHTEQEIIYEDDMLVIYSSPE